MTDGKNSLFNLQPDCITGITLYLHQSFVFCVDLNESIGMKDNKTTEFGAHLSGKILKTSTIISAMLGTHSIRWDN